MEGTTLCGNDVLSVLTIHAPGYQVPLLGASPGACDPTPPRPGRRPRTARKRPGPRRIERPGCRRGGALSTAALLEAAHINRQLLRRLDDPPVTGAERRWWREHFGPPDGSLDQGAPHHMHTNLIDRQWRDRWESLFREARAARWADWERRGLAARMPYGTYWATRSGGVTVLREMWEAKSK